MQKNYWLQKVRHKTLLKVVEWAQQNGKRIQDLTPDDVRKAIATQR